MKFIYDNFYKRLLLSSIILLFSMASFATNYYISNSGNDSNSGLSSALPWQTIGKLNNSMNSFNAGDSILFKKGGIWSGATIVIGKAGIAGKNIIISSYGTGSKPIIQSSVNNPSLQVTTSGRGYWTIDNLDLRATGVYGGLDYSTCIYFNYWGSDLGIVPGWIIQNCSFNACILVSGPNVIIRGNTFNGIGNPNNIRGGIIIRGINGENALIENNEVSNYIDRGVWVMNGAPSVTVRNNKIHNIVGGSDNAGMGINIDGYGVPVPNAKVYGNHIYDCAGVGISNENGYNAEYYNNFIERCALAGLDIIFYGSNSANPSNINFHHNIVVDCNRGFITWDANTYTIANNIFHNGNGTDKRGFYLASSSTYVSNVTFVNNIISGSWTHPISVPDTKAIWAKLDNNIIIPNGTEVMYRGGSLLTLAQVQALGFMTKGMSSNPQFVDAPRNFQLMAGSPAIDAGLDKGYTKDYMGNSIVGIPDIGAYEWGSNTSYTAPGAPTSVSATAGNASASVSFQAPVNNGGSAVTGYTVTSIPAGGTDLNAGSTSLTHSISGLTNGTSYTFTVKATNSAGTSAASVASNAVIPKATVAGTFSFTGPSYGFVNVVSTNFTVTPSSLYTGTVTITFTGTGSAGLSPRVLTFSNSSAPQTFTVTPTMAGGITLTMTNSAGIANAGSLTYTVNATAPSAPTSVTATAGNASASVSFQAPVNNGGSAVTGYTVTSIPAGGTDLNAGSTSLTHSISGLTNGTSYMFNVKATNSAGTSIFSSLSNSVIPNASINIAYLKDGLIETSLSEVINKEVVRIDIFPNPSKGRISIRFSSQPNSGSRIDILDVSGRKVASRVITGISEEFDLDHEAPGLYLVKSFLGSEPIIQKLIITK